MALADTAVATAFREIFRADAAATDISRFSDNSTLDAAIALMIREAEVSQRVMTFYQVFYDRLPEGEGFDFWVAVAADPSIDDARLARFFFDAGEFTALYGGLDDEGRVRALSSRARSSAIF